jgi:Protein of unknown function (DUF935)
MASFLGKLRDFTGLGWRRSEGMAANRPAFGSPATDPDIPGTPVVPSANRPAALSQPPSGGPIVSDVNVPLQGGPNTNARGPQIVSATGPTQHLIDMAGDHPPPIGDNPAAGTSNRSAANDTPYSVRGLDPNKYNPMLSREAESLPNIYTFASLYNLATRSYNWKWDEAYKASQSNALSMRRDAFLMSLFFERIMPTVMMEWNIEVEDKKDEKQLETARRYEAGIRRIPRFRRYLKSAMEAVWYGRAGVQQQWGRRTIDGKDFVTVVRHSPVNGDKVQYSWDWIPRILVYAGTRPELEAQGAKVVLTDRYTALELESPYWRDRFLIHAHDVVDADFFDAEMAGVIQGVGIRHWVYWLDWIKKEISTWMMDYMERVGLGFTIFYYEEGNPQSRLDADAAANAYGRNTRIVWPRSTSGAKVGPGVERIETSTQGAAFIVELMRYFDDKIKRLITGQSPDDSESRPLFGQGEGAAQLVKTQRFTNIAWDCDNLGESLTTDLLDPMIRFNDGQLPFHMWFKFAIEQPDPLGKLQAAKILYDMGIPIKIDEVRAWAGASKPNDNDEVTALVDPAGLGGGEVIEGARDDRREEEMALERKKAEKPSPVRGANGKD